MREHMTSLTRIPFAKGQIVFHFFDHHIFLFSREAIFQSLRSHPEPGACCVQFRVPRRRVARNKAGPRSMMSTANTRERKHHTRAGNYLYPLHGRRAGEVPVLMRYSPAREAVHR